MVTDGETHNWVVIAKVGMTNDGDLRKRNQNNAVYTFPPIYSDDVI